MGHAGVRTISREARSTGGPIGACAIVHPSRGHGRVLCFGGIAGPAGVARQAGGCGWAAGSAWRRFRGKLRSAEIRHSLGDAVAYGGTALSARAFSGWPPRKIFGLVRPRPDNPPTTFSPP